MGGRRLKFNRTKRNKIKKDHQYHTKGTTPRPLMTISSALYCSGKGGSIPDTSSFSLFPYVLIILARISLPILKSPSIMLSLLPT